VTRLAGLRQQLLFLCLANPNPASAVVAWSLFDGTGQATPMAGDTDQPPYESVLGAMKDGWRVIQLPPHVAAAPGREHETAFLRFEYVLEKLIEERPEPGRAEPGRARADEGRPSQRWRWLR
jgi:hypothetical protein